MASLTMQVAILASLMTWASTEVPLEKSFAPRGLKLPAAQVASLPDVDRELLLEEDSESPSDVEVLSRQAKNVLPSNVVEKTRRTGGDLHNLASWLCLNLAAMMPDIFAFAASLAGFKICAVLLSGLTDSAEEVKQITKCDEEEVDSFGCTALHLAAHQGIISEVEELLRKGDDPNAREAWGETPLHLAARGGWDEVCALLLDAGADPQALNKDMKTPLLLAAWSGHQNTFQVLLGGSSDTNVESEADDFGCTELHLAAHHGSLSEMAECLRDGDDPNSREAWGETALHLAARSGFLDACNMLLAAGADPLIENKDGKTAAVVAALSGHAATCRLLLSSGSLKGTFELDDFGCSALHLAAHGASIADVEKLLRLRANPDVFEPWHETPLHMAARAGCPDICALLLAAGSDLEAENKDGKTALALAEHTGHDLVCKLLQPQAAEDTLDEVQEVQEV